MSTCTRRVLTTLEEKGIPYNFTNIDIFQGQHKTQEYLENEQPFGQIPVLHDNQNDYRIYESRAICRYLDDVVPSHHEGGHDLVPKQPELRGHVEQWISLEMSHYKSAETLVAELLFSRMRGKEPNEVNIAENKQKLISFLQILDRHLEGRSYLVGHRFTLADLVFLPYTQYLLSVEEYATLYGSFGNVARWWQTISSRPSWQKVISLK